MEFGGEAEGIGKGAGACGGDGAEGGVVVVGDGLIEGTDGDDVGHILVAIVQEEGRALAVLSEAEGARGEGLRGIPNELFVDVPWAVGEELLDAEVAIVEEDGVGDLAVALHLLVKDPPPHAVKVHGDDLVPLRPTDGAILGVVFHRPLTRFREHLGLCSHLAYARGRMSFGIIVCISCKTVFHSDPSLSRALSPFCHAKASPITINHCRFPCYSVFVWINSYYLIRWSNDIALSCRRGAIKTDGL